MRQCSGRFVTVWCRPLVIMVVVAVGCALVVTRGAMAMLGRD